MPILAEHAEPKRRRAPRWLAGVALIGVTPLALFVWTLVKPISFNIGAREFSSGRVPWEVSPPLRAISDITGWEFTFAFPFRLGGYSIYFKSYMDSG